MRHTWALLALLIGFSGCVAGAEDGDEAASEETVPADVMLRQDVCVSTSCDKCKTRCSKCLHACFEAMTLGLGVSCNDSCSSSCGVSACSYSCGDYETCIESEPAFQIPKNGDTSLQQACEAAVARQVACGENDLATDCTHYSRVEAPESKEYYDCFAAAECGSDAAAACNPPPGGMGNAVCSAVDEACGAGACPIELRDSLNLNEHWLRPDVLNAMRGCLTEPTCDSRAACVNAWVSAVYPQ